eukprot:g1464.t1
MPADVLRQPKLNMLALSCLAALSLGEEGGLMLTRFNNTALSGPAAYSTVLQSLENITDCDTPSETCDQPCSLLLTGQLVPPAPGNYGFRLLFDPPLPYPSPDAYARLWVDDHLLYPQTDGPKPSGGGGVPLWLPLPPRALDASARPIEHAGAAKLSTYEVRVEYVCLAAAGCGARRLTLKWARFDETSVSPLPPGFAPIPASALRPDQSLLELQRRALSTKLQRGWGTYYHPGITTWVLLPESFAVKVGFYRLSTGAFLSPEGLTVDPTRLHAYAVRAGLHSYDNSYMEASVTWRDGGGNLNVSLEATASGSARQQLTLTATLNDVGDSGNASDFALLLFPNFTHGRAGEVGADNVSVWGAAAGLRRTALHLLQGAAVPPESINASLPGMPHNAPLLAVSLGGMASITLSTNATDSATAVSLATAAARANEASRLLRYAPHWHEVADALQTSLMWSLIYDPREGLVFPVTRNWRFGPGSVDGDTTEGLFCWDGSFASYMLSLDALDLSFSNLVQIVKMRTTAGFVPSYSSGTRKTRDRSNPPVTANILAKIVGRWGLNNRTRWVVELLLDDLLNWNTWWWARRREAPGGLLSWGSDPYSYAPDGSRGAIQGDGNGAANLESGLDNGPVMDGVPFNRTGLYLQDEYDAGLTGLFVMDCRAQISLARMLGGRDDAIATLQARLDTTNRLMQKLLWNESAAYFQNKLSDAMLTPVARMAPTHFYPLLAGPSAGGPTAAQARATIVAHLTNPARFAVWQGGTPPVDHPPPPADARPLVQWRNKTTGRHTLCCPLSCNFRVRSESKVRYEGMARLPPEREALAGSRATNVSLTAIFEYACGADSADAALAPAAWVPAAGSAPCSLVGGVNATPALYTYSARTGPAAADLVELELWHNGSDHYVVASTVGKKDAAAAGYTRVMSLGFVWPPPGTANATSLYGLPAVSKDDASYIEQNYWRGRIWAPMIQLVYWALEQYSGSVPEADAAMDGLVVQSKALLMREWRGYGGLNSYAGSGRYVYENFGADTGEGYGYSSEAQPMYSWGALAGFIGLQRHGFYASFGAAHLVEAE